MSDRQWVGHGKGRVPGQPSLELRGGPGMGSGRAGSQPSLSLNSGPGMGSGRAGSQPTMEITGGPGKGGGRAGSQPTIDGPVDFGDDSGAYDPTPAAATGDYRGASSSSAATTGGNKDPRIADPEGAFIFALEVGGTEIAHFTECSGLKTSTEVFEIREGGLNQRTHKLPGQSTWENIILKYGVTSDVGMLSWRSEVLQDQFGLRRNGAIVMKTLGGEEVRRYNFVEGWPVSWEGPNFSAGNSEIAIESLEIAHNGLQIT